MADTFTEVKHEGCFGRLMSSIKNLVGAVVLLFVAVAMLFGNEYFAVKNANNLAAGAAAVVSVDAAAVNAANEGKLIHLTGLATTTELLSDPEFGVTVNALKLERVVEIYQWKESSSTQTRKNVGGSTDQTTTYTYAGDWGKSLTSSANFKQPEGHTNPTAMPYQARTVTATQAMLGGFALTESLLKSLSTTTGLSTLPPPAIPNARINGNGYYIGANPSTPVVGDVRVTFAQVAPQAVSVIAKQVGNSFGAYETTAGGSIEMIASGTQTAAQMFASARKAGAALTWGLRVFGWLLLFAATATLFAPLVVIADVIPFVGNMLQRGVSLISLIIATPIAIAVIIVSWLVARMIA